MENRTSIHVQLNDTAQSDVPLREFVALCNAFQQSLEGVRRCTVSRSLSYAVTDLRHSSAIVDCDITDPADMEDAATVRNAYLHTVDAIESGEPLDARLTPIAIRSFKRMAELASRPTNRLVIGATRLTPQFTANFAKLLPREFTSLGSAEGRLEELSIHHTREFALFPVFTREKIKCLFRKDDLSAVKDAIGKRVIVYGKVTRTESRVFPTSVEVDHFRILANDSDLPTLLDMKGCMIETAAIPDGFREEYY